jgi:hypothetical protein
MDMKQVYDTDILWIMYEFSYLSQFIDEEEHRKKVKAKLDKIIKGKKIIVGLKTQLVGRIRGSNRSRTKEMI